MANEKYDIVESVSCLDIFLIDGQVSHGPTSRRDETDSESASLRRFSNWAEISDSFVAWTEAHGCQYHGVTFLWL